MYQKTLIKNQLNFKIDRFLRAFERTFDYNLMPFLNEIRKVKSESEFIHFLEETLITNSFLIDEEYKQIVHIVNNNPFNVPNNWIKLLKSLSFSNISSLKLPKSIKYLSGLKQIFFSDIKNLELPLELSFLDLKELTFDNITQISFEKGSIYSILEILVFRNMKYPIFPSFINFIQFPHLTEFEYSKSQVKLSIIPWELFTQSIHKIHLEGNGIENIGHDIKLNNTLKYLNLSQNKLMNFPFDLSNLTEEQPKLHLLLDDNSLLELPFEIFTKTLSSFHINWLYEHISRDLLDQYEHDQTEPNLKPRLKLYYKEKKGIELIEELEDTPFFAHCKLLYLIQRFDGEFWIVNMEKELMELRTNLLHFEAQYQEIGLRIEVYSPDLNKLDNLFQKYPFKEKYIDYFMQKYPHPKLDAYFLPFLIRSDGIFIPPTKLEKKIIDPISRYNTLF